MRMLLDEDTQAKRLVRLIKAEGHDVVTVGDCDHRGATDAEILAIARSCGRVLLTRNCADFLTLHQQDTEHPGILCVFPDAEPSKNLGDCRYRASAEEPGDRSRAVARHLLGSERLALLI